MRTNCDFISVPLQAAVWHMRIFFIPALGEQIEVCDGDGAVG